MALNYMFSGPVIIAVGRQTADAVQLLGTGFGVATDRIATAAHVVGHSDQGLVAILPKGAPNDYQDTTDNQVQLAPMRIVAFDPVRDIAILELSGMTMGQSPSLRSTDATVPGTPIVTHGYPHTDMGRLVLTQNAAMVGAKILLGTSMVKTKHIVLNIQTRPGQSGSPVFLRQEICAMVVGAYRPAGGVGMIVAGVDPATLHQTTHAVSAEYIQGMMQ